MGVNYERAWIKEKVVWSNYDGFYLTPLDKVIEKLTAQKEAIAAVGGRAASLEAEYERDYGDSVNVNITIHWERPETDEEMQKRIAAAEKVSARAKADAEQRRLRKEEAERSEFLRLQAKFKDNPELWRK
jgi:hypothetical protein